MNFRLISEYSIWLVFVCLALGFLYSFLLYRKEKSLSEMKGWLLWIIASARFTVISFIAFLLLNPMIKTISRQVEKPIIVIAQDNSESIILNKDSSYYKVDYKKNIDKLVEELSDKYEVHSISFGDSLAENLNFSFKEKQTSISDALDLINNNYSNRNLGALIIASDGLYNKGANPIYASSKFKIPIYTIALGDTNIRKDIILAKVNYNRISFLGNKFPVEIVVSAKQCKGLSTTVTISKNNNALYSKAINFTDNNSTNTFSVELEAKEAGLQRYRISLSSVPSEVTIQNNAQDIFIDVLNSRQKILILGNTPHPDIAAIKESIEQNENYEVEVAFIDNFTKNLQAYNLVILHQLPSVTNSADRIFGEIAKSNIPALIIVGSQTNTNAFTNLKLGLSLSGTKGKQNTVQATTESTFSLFTLSENTRRFIPKLPPLYTFFGNYKTAGIADVLFWQKIGVVNTDQPLIMFNQVSVNKTGIICGEGLWRWRLADFAAHENQEVFNEIIGKIIQYLSVKIDKSYFRVITKNNILENEAVLMDAEVYNESYELINDPDINIDILNKENKKFSFTFTKTSKAYHLNAGLFPVGDYRFEANVKVGNKIFSDKGEFSVIPLLIESMNTVADHQILYTIAKRHNGDMFYPTQIEDLKKKIDNRDDIKNVSYTHKKLHDIINLKWLFVLIIGLLSMEWFIRKRNGSY